MLLEVRSDLKDEFERKISWLGKPRPFLSSYKFMGWTVGDSPNFLNASIDEIGLDEVHENRLDPSIELHQTLRALQLIETEGFPLPLSCEITHGKDSLVLSRWADGWLADSSPRDHIFSFVHIIPQRLHHLLPDNFNELNSARDLLAVVAPKLSINTKYKNESIPRFSHSFRSLADIARAMRFQSHSVTSTERFGIYQAFLQGSAIHEPGDDTYIDPCFLERFCRIVTAGSLCPRSIEGRMLARRFLNRTVDLDSFELSESILPELSKLDFPLHAKLSCLKFCGVRNLAGSIFACALEEPLLTKLWDSLLVSSPRLLELVISLLLIEVRSAVLECSCSQELQDLVLSAVQIVDDFPGILAMAETQASNDPI